MEPSAHPLSELFAQLGLPTEAAEIDAFITKHAPLAGDVPLDQAPFWNAAQANFLREELHEDADWAEVIDDLNERLRA